LAGVFGGGDRLGWAAWAAVWAAQPVLSCALPPCPKSFRRL
jgi:hypothetical protein